MTVAAGILSAALGASRGKKIRTVALVVGELAGIEEECLGLCWEAVSEDTLCSDSRLDIRYVPAELVCRDCGRKFPLRENRMLLCPFCGGEARLANRADELYIASVETYDKTNT